MSNIYVAGLLPAIATVLLGYIASWHQDFGAESALNRMTLTYVLPVAIFVDTVTTPRSFLIKDLRLLAVLSVSIIAIYCAVFLVWRFLLRFSLAWSALAALIAAAPNGGYVGVAVFGDLYRGASGVPIAISALLNWLIVTPATVAVLAHDEAAATRRPHSVGAHSPVSTTWLPPSGAISRLAALNAFRQPIVWAPLLGFIMILMRVPVPRLAANVLSHASMAVALFASGVILSRYAISTSRQVLALAFIKNIAQPALVWAAVFVLGYSYPLLGETVVTVGLPVLVLTVMLATRFRVAEQEAASALLLSMVSSLVTIPGLILLTS